MVSISPSVVSGPDSGGYLSSMSPLEQFIAEVEDTIVDNVDHLSDAQAAVLYAGVLDFEQRLDGLRDALSLIASTRS